MTKIVGVIPARKGSKGVLNKNFRSFYKQQSLTDLSITFAESLNLDRIIISTDYKYENFKFSKTILHKRSEHAASDLASDFDVLLNLLEDKALTEKDVLVWLRPTSPLRCEAECSSALEKFFANNNFACIRSIKSAETHPYWMKVIDNNLLKPFTNLGNDTTNPRRQGLPPVYQISSEFEIIRVSEALKQHVFFPEPMSYYVTKKYPKTDIDTKDDYQIASKIYESYFK